jgi:DNA repair exonuclease SbcCD nuclease subunit
MGAYFKFIHCADLHLDAPFKNVSGCGQDAGQRMTGAALEALDTIVDKAISSKADFIIFSGDIFDHEYCTPRSRYLFAEALKRAKMRCYIAYGNHDHARRWEESIPFPENAVVFPEYAVNVPYPNETDKLCDVIGISHSAKEEPRDLTEDISGTSCFSIAAVHCDIDSASEGKRYAPVKLSSMINKNIDDWALGHIHKRIILHKFPHIVYPGNTQGMNPKESGEKGAYLVTVGNGVVTDMEFFRTSSILWQDIDCDITGKDMISVVEEISEAAEKGAMIRIRLTGRGDLDRTIRSHRDGFAEMIGRRGCTVTHTELGSGPLTDTGEHRSGFLSSVMSSGDSFMDMNRNDLISAICSTKASASVRHVFEAMDDAELYEMVRDARTSLTERFTEGRP